MGSVVLRGLGRSLALRGDDSMILLRALLWLISIQVALRLHRFQRVVMQARPVPGPAERAVSVSELRRARRYAWALEMAGRRVLGTARCLERSLALHHWLRRERLPSHLRIGVRRERGALTAHAWVELSGQVVNDEPVVVAEFTPLVGPPLGAAAGDRDERERRAEPALI